MICKRPLLRVRLLSEIYNEIHAIGNEREKGSFTLNFNAHTHNSVLINEINFIYNQLNFADKTFFEVYDIFLV